MNGSNGHEINGRPNGRPNGVKAHSKGVHVHGRTDDEHEDTQSPKDAASGCNGNHPDGPNNDFHTVCNSPPASPAFEPIAVCGMACRLPGGINCPQEMWDFLIQGRDARTRVPKSRFNIDGYYSSTRKPGTVNTEFGYFLDDSVDLAALDTSFLSMSRGEVERLDPQQRMMLEVARESLDDAGETKFKGSNVGVYIGCFGNDWYDIINRDGLSRSMYSVTASHDFMISARVSHEMDLRGPWYVEW